MFFRQFYDQPLAQASYLIGCQATGDAIVIDPLRDITAYQQVAASEGLRISHVSETHIHADFVSGLRELVAATGARAYVSAEGGADWQYRFAAADGATLVRDGDVIRVGNITLQVMHTPGHTPEHICFVVTDTPRAAGPMGILTGDFVFVGDVGRPDLLERAAGFADTMVAGARTLFHSLAKFRALPDHLQVWPAHGAGSACGKALGAVPSSTVGYEKLSNWGVAETNEEQFVTSVLDGQPEPPRYFAEMKRINRDGPPVLGPAVAKTRLTAKSLDSLAPSSWVIDLRPAAEVAAGYVPGALAVAYGKSFSTWVGSIVPYDADLVLIASAQDAQEPTVVHNAAHDLRLIGLDRVLGWIDADDALAHLKVSNQSPATVHTISPAELAALGEQVHVIDVRGESEWREGHLPGATHVPLGSLMQRVRELPDGPLVMQCQSGARSVVATSLLQRLGHHGVRNLQGGYVGWRRSRDVALGASPTD